MKGKALATCWACDGLISHLAETCPHCGLRIKPADDGFDPCASCERFAEVAQAEIRFKIKVIGYIFWFATVVLVTFVLAVGYHVATDRSARDAHFAAEVKKAAAEMVAAEKAAAEKQRAKLWWFQRVLK